MEEVNFNGNEIKEIPDLSKFRFLKKLNLSNNLISKIEGLNKNMNLQVILFNVLKLRKIKNFLGIDFR